MIKQSKKRRTTSTQQKNKFDILPVDLVSKVSEFFSLSDLNNFKLTSKEFYFAKYLVDLFERVEIDPNRPYIFYRLCHLFYTLRSFNDFAAYPSFSHYFLQEQNHDPINNRKIKLPDIKLNDIIVTLYRDHLCVPSEQPSEYDFIHHRRPPYIRTRASLLEAKHDEILKLVERSSNNFYARWNFLSFLLLIITPVLIIFWSLPKLISSSPAPPDLSIFTQLFPPIVTWLFSCIIKGFCVYFGKRKFNQIKADTESLLGEIETSPPLETSHNLFFIETLKNAQQEKRNEQLFSSETPKYPERNDSGSLNNSHYTLLEDGNDDEKSDDEESLRFTHFSLGAV